jgi:uncharacterized membrane protein
MKAITPKKNLFYLFVTLTCILLLASCKTFKELANNKPVYTKKARWVPGNAKSFQKRHDAKLKKMQTHKL